jgi:hypothetical protein
MPRARVPALAAALIVSLPAITFAQSGGHTHGAHRDSAMVGMADQAMGGSAHGFASRHLVMSESRPGTREDTLRAMQLAQDIRDAIARYRDPAVAAADGYRQFLPNVKNQKVYHFTNARHALAEAFRFDLRKPTSLLYKPGSDGSMVLIGAMYTMPRRAPEKRLDDRIPLSIARWHKHVNWCLPPKGEERRWLEQKDGHPIFGPESPIATRAECDAAGGNFHENLFGWMLHANVFEGTDVGTIYGHEH